MIVSNPSTATSYGLHAGNMKAGSVAGTRFAVLTCKIRRFFLP
jgi:hypothetical protein